MTYERYQKHRLEDGNGASAKEIQRDAAEIRSEMDGTIADIFQQLQPEELIKKAVQNLRAGHGGRFVSNLTHTISENPVPIAMIATGFGYLMYNDAQQRRQPGEATSAASQRQDGSSRAREKLEDARAQASQASDAVSDKAGELSGRARQGKEQAREKASELADEATDRVPQAARRGQELLHEQPMVLAGLGIALGAAMAGTAPLSEEETELVGEHGDRALDELQGAARRVGDHAQAVGHTAANEAQRRARPEEPNGSASRAPGDAESSGPSAMNATHNRSDRP